MTIFLATLLTSGIFVGCSQEASSGSTAENTASDEKYEIVVTHIVDENHTWHKAALKFEEIVEANSDGRIDVVVYPNSSLGTELDALQAMLTNTGIDITFTAESMQTYAEELGLIGMPYAITSNEHLMAVLDGEVGDEIENIMIDTGFRSLGYFVRGPRNVTANEPINTPDDLQGFIIRTPQSPMTVAAFEAMGAKPTPMAFGEVFTSLQNNVIDGQENPLAMIKSGAFFEVQDYIIETEHLRSWVYIAMGEQKFQSLPEDLKQVVLDAGAEAQAYEHELFLVEENSLRDEMIANGMEFVEVDQSLFAEKAIAGVEEILTENQQALYEKIKAANPAN
ncbi:C4-dicarboxylate ABC transporter [Candidatus Epulonipiscium fishelsonii]|uniref:C4-dicarboxylate ABC transporter n=1 Tax=Candidatus Epulonipiscium fishelsonii TaxID=77094 RepID=A0ACC8X8Z2_9FIRM|nr:C4-dicarboxylate ABC transporter [Epulopiscium sp. SCG-B05WGA-EpuloA1]ONI38546.1 C4-dicarboxylate ABC transporter [Epulopiscium sp. SCG-B11WGA-EpuloA1]